MKRIMKFAALVALMMAPALSHAGNNNTDETPKNEISVGIGVCPASDLINSLGNGLATGFSAGHVISEGKCIGVFNVDYTRNVTKWLGVGANVSYSCSKTNDYRGIRTKQDDGSYLVTKGEHYAKDVSNNFTLMPTLKFNWFRRDHITMYSRLSAGVTLQQQKMTYDEPSSTDKNENEVSVHFNGQISPIGLEAGSKSVRAFTELGFGQAGIVQLGLRYRF